jgi:hypothetical protein
MPHLFQRFMLLFILLTLTAGCVTNIKPSTETNPSPLEKFSAFNRFELIPLKAANNEVAEQKAAMLKIEENIQDRLGKRLQPLNDKAVNGTTRTLVIEPTVTELKFVSGGKRFFAGAWAGSSAVVLKAKFTEKESGKSIATPEFYSHASAMSGAATFGGNDNAMLVRIANSLAVYVLQNYKQAVGGSVMPSEIEASSIPLD